MIKYHERKGIPLTEELQKNKDALDTVRGLEALMTDMPERVQQVALKWFAEQQLTAVSLIAEGELNDIFIGTLPIPQSGVLAVVLRKRLAKMRAS